MLFIQKNSTTHKTSNGKALLYYVLYFLFIIAIALWCFKKPLYNWDMLPYIAIIVQTENKDINTIHSITYNTAKKEVPAQFYGQLTDTSNIFRRKMAENAKEFSQQLPFYSVKPLYAGLIYLFYKAGFSLSLSTIVPSFFAYVLLALILFHWLKKYLNLFIAFTAGLFIMVSAPLLNVARTSTPDGISAFLLFSATYFIIERPKLLPAYIFLVLSIFTRIDNIIPSVCILSLVAFSSKSKIKISFGKYLFLLLLLVAAYCSVTICTGYLYGWNILFYPSFLQSMNLSHTMNSGFSLNDYIALVYNHIINGLQYSYLLFFLFLLALVFRNCTSFQLGKMNFDCLFSLLIFFIIIIRFVLDPDISDRFYIAWYLSTIILFARSISPFDAGMYEQISVRENQ